jgi:hypothetical protein
MATELVLGTDPDTLRAVHAAEKGGVGAEALQAASGLAMDASSRASALSEVLRQLGLGALLPSARRAAEGGASPEQKLYLWNPIAEELEASEFEWAMEQLGGLPGDVYPLLRLCVIHRLRHRWEGRLSEEQQARMQELITKAEADLEAHFVRFNEMVEEEIERRVSGDGRSAGA